MKKSIFFAFLLLLGFSTYTVNAATIFLDETALRSTLGETFIDDYESDAYQHVQNNNDMDNVFNQTKYIPTGHPDINIVGETFWSDHYYCAGCNGSFLLDFTGTSLSTELGIYGIGINFFNVDRIDDNAGDPPVSIPKYSAYVTFGNNLSENFLLPSGPWPDTHFWGITSDQGIKSIHFGFLDGRVTQDGDFGILDLTIGNQKAALPEPSAIILLCMGVVGILIRRRVVLTF
jgi:hypothetical protein